MKAGVRYGLIAVAAALLIAVFVDMARSVTNRPKLDNTVVTGQVYRGGQWSLSEHRGKSPVLMSFFATWCGPCRLEYPHLVELQKKMAGKGVQIVLLTQEDTTDIDRDPEYSKSPLTIITGADQAFTSFNVNSIPRTIVFNSKGAVELDLAGYSEDAVRQIEEALTK